MKTMQLFDIELEVIAKAFDPTKITGNERDLVIRQGLPGARAMFEAETLEEKEDAKRLYIKAALFHVP